MAAYTQPTYYFPGIKFDSSFYGADDSAVPGLTQASADVMYLIKIVPDTASSITYYTGILAAGNIQALSTTSSVDIACNNSLGSVNFGLLTTDPINIGNSGNTTNFNSATNVFTSLTTSQLISNSIKYRYLDWRNFTMSIKGSGGTGTTVSIVGSTVSSTFCVAGNIMHIKHYYAGPAVTSVIGTGVYGFTLPTNTDTGFPFVMNSIFPQTNLTATYPEGATFGSGAFIQPSVTTGTINNVSYKVISSVPYLFLFFISGQGGVWQNSSVYPYGSVNMVFTWSASIPIIIS